MTAMTQSPPQRIAALVLAAGCSSRMGGVNKLFEPVGGIPLLQRAVNAARASRACAVTVVTGHEAQQMASRIAAPGIHLAHNPDYALGLSTSLRCGIGALSPDVEGVIVLLGDMPFVSASLINRIIEAYARQPTIIVPTKDGRRGNPVLWPRRYFPEILELTGDQGARELLLRYAGQSVNVEADSTSIFTDVDTLEALSTVRAAC